MSLKVFKKPNLILENQCFSKQSSNQFYIFQKVLSELFNANEKKLNQKNFIKKFSVYIKIK
jgi:hypothetical protein